MGLGTHPIRDERSRRLAQIAVLWGVLLVGLQSCRVAPKKTDAKGAAVTATSQAPGGGTAGYSGRLYFQTREAISVALAKDTVASGQSFTLLNTTQSAGDDSKAIVLLQDVALSQPLPEQTNYSVSPAADGGLIVTFYPAQTGWASRFFYGVNTVKVLVDDNPEHTEVIQLTLADFSVIDSSLAAFADNKDIDTDADGDAFEAWTTVVSASTVVTADGTTLTTGASDLINGR